MLVVPAGGAAGGEDAVDVDPQAGSFAREASRWNAPSFIVAAVARELWLVAPASWSSSTFIVPLGLMPVVPEAAVHADRPLAEHALDLVVLMVRIQ